MCLSGFIRVIQASQDEREMFLPLLSFGKSLGRMGVSDALNSL